MRFSLPGATALRRLFSTRSPWETEDEVQSVEIENMIPYLKIKVKSLAAEARFIRQAERRLKGHRYLRPGHPDTTISGGQPVKTDNPRWRPLPASLEACVDEKERNRFRTFWGLREHRMGLRTESRHNGLAYGFLRKRDYSVMEQQAHTRPNWDKIEKVALKFGGDERDIKQRFAAWKAAAKEWYTKT